MTLNKAQKLVKIVELMSRRGGVRSEELMHRFDLDPRSLRRYMADLRAINLPLVDQGVGFERTIGLESDYRRAGVQLSLAEVLSLHFGRKLFTFLEGTQFASDLDDAIERLQPAIPRAHADLTRDLDRRFMAVSEHAKDYQQVSDLIDDVVTALLYNNVVEAEYTRAAGDSRPYRLEPYTLATYRQGLYLFARDQVDGRVKTFAVERFDSFRRLRSQKFDMPQDFDPQALLNEAFGITGGEPVKVSVLFDEQAAPYVQERRWHKSQHLEDLADGRLRLQLEVALSDELVTWLLGFAGAAVIEGPPELAHRVRDAHLAALDRLETSMAKAEPVKKSA